MVFGWERPGPFIFCVILASVKRLVKIYLLRLDSGLCIFYSEGPEALAEIETVISRRGLRGWIERKYKSLQVILNESEKGVGLRVRRIWEWLQKRIPPDEPVLRAMRGAHEIKLYYPLGFGEAETITLWKVYLKSRQGRHMFWFIANTLVCPLTLVFAPLPGPNVVGYWFVYRAVCHLLARLGARHARSERVETEYLSATELDGSFGANDQDRIASVSSMFGLSGLDVFINRMNGTNKNARRKAPLATTQ